MRNCVENAALIRISRQIPNKKSLDRYGETGKSPCILNSRQDWLTDSKKRGALGGAALASKQAKEARNRDRAGVAPAEDNHGPSGSGPRGEPERHYEGDQCLEAKWQNYL